MPAKFKIGDPVKISQEALNYATANTFLSDDNPMQYTGRIIRIVPYGSTSERWETYLYRVKLDPDKLQIGGVLNNSQYTRLYHDWQLSIDTRVRRDDSLKQILEQ